ncbi:PAS domain-containing sensor histidine kinase [Dictyobacter aurantiacus]|uniref:histidine kinase n=1 Tax=Dictyobacter aurantiacus TaxID=1936993 RepID=A0A401ZP94_9CHLR|nr:PAS domain S-box protein [Dictyobacter aurantiacus]GCE08697.1 hypothetical protein KDAU_60260 [Dictyobacter aurantiacus]
MKQEKTLLAPSQAGIKLDRHNLVTCEQAPRRRIEDQTYIRLIEMSRDAMIICDPQQHIQLWNGSAEELYGWTKQEVIGCLYHELLQSKPNEKNSDSMYQLLQEDQWEGELLQTRRDGKLVVVKSRQSILKDDTDYPDHILIVNQDITTIKKPEQKLQDHVNLTACVQNIGFWSWNVLDDQQNLSDQILSAFDHQPRENPPNGPQVMQTVQAANPANTKRVLQQALKTGHKYIDEYILTDSCKHKHWIEVQGRVYFDEQCRPIKMMGIAIDVTRQKQKEHRLHASNHYLHTILDSLKDSFFLLDKQWHFIYVNQQAARLIHRSADDLIGHNIWESVPSLKNTIFEEKAQEAIHTQESIHFETFFAPHRCWYDVHLHPIPEGLSVNYNDVTAHKQTEIALRASEHKFKALIDANIIGFMLAERDGKIVEVNDKLLEMLDYTQEDVATGRLNWRNVTPDEYRSIDDQAVKDIQETGVFMPFEKEYRDKHGQRVPVMIAGTIVDNTRHLCAIIVVDLRTQKQLEKQKEMFMSIVGHELRTPLTAINGSVQLAQRRIQRFLQERPDKLPSDVEVMINKLYKLLEQSLRQTRVQNRLINDMLDVSRLAIDRLELFMQPGNLISVVKETVDDLHYTEGNHPISLILPEQRYIPVLMDSDRISQVVANYISNALKYSDPDAPITVEITADDSQARVWVHDRGEGMSKEEQKQIWNRYYRTNQARDKKATGVNLGLGLHICQVLIERHHGQVGVTSRKGKGTSFWFSLPLMASGT